MPTNLKKAVSHHTKIVQNCSGVCKKFYVEKTADKIYNKLNVKHRRKKVRKNIKT